MTAIPDTACCFRLLAFYALQIARCVMSPQATTPPLKTHCRSKSHRPLTGCRNTTPSGQPTPAAS
jgi:hypothetical protein